MITKTLHLWHSCHPRAQDYIRTKHALFDKFNYVHLKLANLTPHIKRFSFIRLN